MGRILVTGAAGFIGSHVLEALLARGDQLVGLDNFDPFYDPAIKRRRLSAIQSRWPDARLLEGDIRSPDSWARAAAQGPYDAIIHLAALAGVRSSLERPDEYASVNVAGTERVLDFARTQGISRVVHASSSSVYGDCADGPIAEDAPTDRPLSPYAATKIAGEALCRSAHERDGTSVTILRFFSVYGPRQRPDMAITRFVDAIREGRPIPVFGAGDSWRDYTFVTDIVAGILASLQGSGLRTYNLGAGRPVRLLDLIDLLGRTLKLTPEPTFLPAPPGDARYTCAAIDRARRELGYQPRVTIEEGLRLFCEWHASERPS